MKKRAKKLVLSKETVQDLDGDLRQAAGGSIVTGVVCPYSAPYFCPRQPATGVTCYC